MKEILQSYLKRLTNLSGNNRSLLLLKLNVEQFIDLHDLDHVNGAPSWQIMEQLMDVVMALLICLDTSMQVLMNLEIKEVAGRCLT